MKIVYILTRSDVIGGASIHLLDLADAMQKDGHDVTLIVGGNGVFFEHAKQRKLNCIAIPSLVREINLYKDFLAYKQIKKVVQALQPDLIHTHSSKAGILGRLVATKLHIPCVFTAHGWSFTDGVPSLKSFVFKHVEKFFLRYSSKIITVSKYDENLALSHIGGHEKIITIHNGVHDYSQFSKKNEQCCQIIMVARFDAPKDQELLIKSLSELKNLNWTLRFAGAGPSLEGCKQLVSKLELTESIAFLGARNDVSTLLEQSDIFVLTSNWEGLPLTILEAMSASLPVIASDVGGVSESIKHNETGFLVPRGSQSQLIEALEKLIISADLREKMGKAGRAYFLEEFQFSIMLERTQGVYKRLLSI
ncbi:glycosyltransferase family 4 protein [Pseudomonas sp. F1_0610]|uniref:glycosyltransferase family 4 protein n=1 Tax=Pseudomonas sp. F1_0610 TaxID=3114284 RepID=UPI0039C23EFD